MNDHLQQFIESALTPTADPTWVMRQEGYDPTREIALEARFAISNGLIGVRGSREVSRGPVWMYWQEPLSWASWPRTYIAGLFDTPDMVPPTPALTPAPDWLRIRVFLDGEPLLLRTGNLIALRRILDLRRGLLITEWNHRATSGHVVRIRSLRLVSMADRVLGVQILTLNVEGRTAEIKFEALLEAAGTGLEPVELEPDLTTWQTALSGKELAIASTAALNVDGVVLEPGASEPLKRSWVWISNLGKSANFLRLVAFGRGGNESESASEIARTALTRGQQAGWRSVIEAHEQSWVERWTCSDVEVDGDPQAQEALRFAIYHLNGAVNPMDERSSIGARALMGDAYLGHVFWDTEIHLLPFYTLTWPAAARALLMYRYHTLPAARAKARGMGYRGALYAWESADTGEEATPSRVIDPSGRVISVLCGAQEQHISADIAYAIWQYWQATADHEFLLEAGAEIVMETARFWASRATLEADGRYHIRSVIGPDEYHENIDDNAFTNGMARWNIARGLEVAGLMRERWPERFRDLTDQIHVRAEELELWREVADRMVTGFDPQTSLLEQFTGYFDLEDIDLSLYTGRSAPMDIVLGRERTQQSQVLKQADVIALFALLPESFDRDAQRANFRYYEPRCGHGSSLSSGVHALVAARLGDVELADRYFRKTAETDLGMTTDISGGGIRIGAQGALWQAVVFGFAGLTLRADGLALDPHLPNTWQGLRFRVQWKQRRVSIQIGQGGWLSATLEDGEPMTLYVGSRPHALLLGRMQRIGLNNMPPDAA